MFAVRNEGLLSGDRGSLAWGTGILDDTTGFADFIHFGCSTRVRRFTAGYTSAGTPSAPMLIFLSEQ